MAEEIKAPEKTKEEMFKDNPEEFFHITDLAMAVTADKGEGRKMFISTHSPMELGGLLFLLQRHINHVLDCIAMEKLKEKKMVQDITAKGGFRKFINGGKK